jgi:hypothetical protein
VIATVTEIFLAGRLPLIGRQLRGRRLFSSKRETIDTPIARPHANDGHFERRMLCTSSSREVAFGLVTVSLVAVAGSYATNRTKGLNTKGQVQT